MSKRTGLPPTVKMRHDQHYVESISTLTGASIGKMIPIDKIEPNPDQPRKVIGDLRELTLSIREKGVLEPLLVTYDAPQDMYIIIAGERRFHASKAAGLSEVPCVEKTVDAAEMLEIALIENLQRKDLDAFEEADGLYSLAEQFDYTHEEIAQRIGKARATVSETLALRAIPAQVRKQCRNLGITSKSVLLQIARQPSERKMGELAGKLASGMSRSEARKTTRAGDKVKLQPYVYTYRDPDGAFDLRMKFRKAVVPRRELRETLAAILEALEVQPSDR